MWSDARGGRGAAAASRDDVLRRAQEERAARARAANERGRALIVARALRGHAARASSQRQLKAELTGKLAQYRTLAEAVRRAKGVELVPPPQTVLDLMGKFCLSLRATTKSIDAGIAPDDADLLTSICDLVDTSVKQPAGSVLCAGEARAALKRLLRVLSRALRERLLPVNARLTACRTLHGILFNDTTSAATQTALRGYTVDQLQLIRTVSIVCAGVASDEGGTAVIAPLGERQLGRACVDTAARLMQGNNEAVRQFWLTVLPLPILLTRLSDDANGVPRGCSFSDPVFWEMALLRLPTTLADCHTALPEGRITGVDGQKRSSNTLLQRLAAAPTGAALLCVSNIVHALTLPVVSAPPSGHQQVILASALSPVALCRALQQLLAVCSALPPDFWSSAAPVLWLPPSPSGAQQPLPLPKLLSSQLRKLSGAALARALSRACVGEGLLARALITHDRVALDASTDPEAGTYDPYALTDIVLPRGLAAPSSSSSHLSSRPSAVGALLAPMAALFRGVGKAATTAASAAAAATTAAPSSLFAWARRRREARAATATAIAPHPTSNRGYTAVADQEDEDDDDGASSTASGAVGASAEAGAVWPSDNALTSFASLYATLVAPPHRARGLSSASGPSEADALVGRSYVLNALAFSPSLALPWRLWVWLHQGGGSRLSSFFAGGDAFKSAAAPSHPVWAALALLACLLGHLAVVADDAELYGSFAGLSGDGGTSGSGGTAAPRRRLRGLGGLPLRELRHAVRLFRDLLVHAEGVGVTASTIAVSALAAPATPFWPRVSSAAASLLRLLYDRHCIRPLGPRGMWVVEVDSLAVAPRGSGSDEKGGGGSADTAQARLLSAGLPFAIPFPRRAALFNAVREADRAAAQTAQPQVRLVVHRGPRLFETAYASLCRVPEHALRRKFAVVFVNEAGVEETGIDAGGLFKELVTSLSALVFAPEYGLFRRTPGGGELYPNPASALCSGLPVEAAFEFVGKLIGKAVYEGITLGPRFTPFLLAHLTGRPVGLHHLPSLDPELYRSLLFVRECADAATLDALCLTFTVPADMDGGGGGGSSGDGGEVELIPGGADVAVTPGNRHRYVHLVAEHRLSRSTAAATAALTRGLYSVLPPAWLAPFSPPELQVLVSGTGAALDVADWRKHTAYSGGYTSVHTAVRDFWAVIEGLDEGQRGAVVRFVTSSPRPPPLGFAQLSPPFTIQRVDGGTVGALPSASTCFNVLKLPSNYRSRSELREKLLMAVTSGAGFELT